jgi:mono/diheme cytochrome c family protein
MAAGQPVGPAGRPATVAGATALIARNAAADRAAQNPPMHSMTWRVKGRSLAGLVALVAAAGAVLAQRTTDPLPGEFIVIDGRVDAGTYAGWKLFHTSCHGCHGVGGVGTDIAPNLVAKIGNYTPRGFAAKVLTSYRIVPMSPDSGPPESAAERDALLELVMKRERQARGQPLMPAWDTDAEVPAHVLDLYAYLNARAEGGLGPGRPKRLPDKPR